MRVMFLVLFALIVAITDTAATTTFNATFDLTQTRRLCRGSIEMGGISSPGWPFFTSELCQNDTFLMSLNPCKDWSGVVCTPLVGNSTYLQELHLGPDSWISGNISCEIAMEEYLGVLDIQGLPSITGPIPECLCTMAGIGTLSLYNNQLAGEIPECLWDMQNLYQLDLGGNNLTGQISSRIGDGKSPLQKLDLSFNRLRGPLPPGLSKKHSLSVLYFQGNPIGGTLPPEYSALDLLEHWYFYSCGLEGPIPDSYQVMTNFKFLLGYDNKLTGTLPPWLGTPNIVVLDLSRNNFEGPIPATYFPAQLTRLQLDNNKLNGTIPNTMVNGRLLKLTLSNNQLSGALPLSLCNPRSLQTLDLSNNTFYTELPSCLPGSVTAVNFSWNKFVGYLPTQWRLMPNLVDLIASHNLIEGTLEDLAAALPVTVRTVDLSQNSMSPSRSRNSYYPFWFDFEHTVVFDTENMECYGTTFHGEGQVILDPICFNFTNCFCEAGYFGVPPNCMTCPATSQCIGGFLVCLPLYYKANDKCLICPPGITCDGTDILVAPMDHWIHVDKSGFAALYLCPSGFCQSQPDHPNTCAPHRLWSSPLCGTCEEGYYDWNFKCVSCEDFSWALLVGLIFTNWPYIIVQLILVQSRGRGDSKIFSSFLQTVAVLVYQSGPLSALSSIFNLKSSSSFGVCVAPWGYYQKLTFNLLHPLICFLFLAITIGILFLVQLARPTLSIDLATLFSRTAIALMLSSYAPVIQDLFSLLNCEFVGDMHVNVEHPSVHCSGALFSIWQVVSIVLIVFVIGGEATAFLLSYRYRNRVMSGGSKKSKLNMDRVGLIFESYKDKWYWWETVLLVRRAVILLLWVLFYDDTPLRSAVLTGTLAFFTVAQLAVQPFNNRSDNALETLALFTLQIITVLTPLNTGELALPLLALGVEFIFICHFAYTRGSSITRLCRHGSRRRSDTPDYSYSLSNQEDFEPLLSTNNFKFLMGNR